MQGNTILAMHFMENGNLLDQMPNRTLLACQA